MSTYQTASEEMCACGWIEIKVYYKKIRQHNFVDVEGLVYKTNKGSN